MAVALRSPRRLTRTSTSLLAAGPSVDALARSLHESHLSALEDQGDGDGVSRETPCGYFAVGCNAATPAAVLGVDRRPVAGRLDVIGLGGLLHTCRPELEVALRCRTWASVRRPGDGRRPAPESDRGTGSIVPG